MNLYYSDFKEQLDSSNYLKEEKEEKEEVDKLTSVSKLKFYSEMNKEVKNCSQG